MVAAGKRALVVWLGLFMLAVLHSPVRAESVPAAQTPQHLMMVLVNSACPFQRECAADELSKLDWHANGDVVQTLVIAAQRDAAPSVRAASVRALTYMKCDTVAVTAALQACRKDADRRVQHAAQVGLEQLHATHADAKTPDAASDVDEELGLQDAPHPSEPAARPAASVTQASAQAVQASEWRPPFLLCPVASNGLVLRAAPAAQPGARPAACAIRPVSYQAPNSAMPFAK